MRARVDEETCNGCGLCTETCPGVFGMDGRMAIVKADPVAAGDEKRCRVAARECPVNAISISEPPVFDIAP